MTKHRLIWTVWPSSRHAAGSPAVPPWSAIVEARGEGRLELAGHDHQFYTGAVAVCPSRGWTFRSPEAAFRAYRRRRRAA